MLAQVATCAWEKATPDEFWGYETSLEGVLTLDPDVIILNNWSESSRQEMLAALSNDPLWNELWAVQAQRVFGTENYENPIASSLPAAQKFLDTYMPLMYPDVFPQALTDEQVGEAGPRDAQFPVTIKDGLGRELTFDKPPERVVCLSSICVPELAALGIKPIAVHAPWGYALALDPLNYGDEARDWVQITDDAPDKFEVIAGLKPDLVIGHGDEFIEPLKSIAPVYAIALDFEQGATVESYAYNVQAYGAIFGKTNQAEALVAAVFDRIEAYAKLSPASKSITVFTLSDEGSTIWFPPDCGVVLKRMGPCGHSKDGLEWFSGSIETLLAFNPDVLIMEDWGEGTGEWARRLVAEDPLWQELRAVTSSNFHILPASSARFSDLPALGRALDAIMPLAYPDVFPQALTDEQVKEILKR
jgi:iron complex transport system substrate-binding protein